MDSLLYFILFTIVLWTFAMFVGWLVTYAGEEPFNWRIIAGPNVYIRWAFSRPKGERGEKS